MRRRLLILILLCSPAWAANPTLVCSHSNASTTGTSVACTGTTTSGAVEIVMTQHRSGDLISAVALSDGGDTVWNIADGRTEPGSQPICASSPFDNCNFAYIIPSAGGGSKTFTESWTTTEQFAQIAVIECTSCSSDPWDGVAQNFGTTSGSSGAANGFGGVSTDVAVSMCSVDGTVGTGSGFTSLGTLATPSTVIEYKTAASSTSTGTCTNSSSNWTTAIVVTLKTANTTGIFVRQAVSTIGSSSNITTAASGGLVVTGSPGGTLGYLAGQSAGTLTLSLVDSGAHTWTSIFTHNTLSCFSGSFQAACISGYLANFPTGVTWVQVRGNAGDNGSFAFIELGGIATSSPLDVSNDTSNGTAASYTSPNVTTTSANEMMIGVFVSTANSCCAISSLAATGSWTNAYTYSNPAANVTQIAYQNVSSTQTSVHNSGTITFSSGSTGNWDSGIATFIGATQPSAGKCAACDLSRVITHESEKVN